MIFLIAITAWLLGAASGIWFAAWLIKKGGNDER